MPRLSVDGAAAVENLFASIDHEIQRSTRAAIAQHVDAFHRRPLLPRRRLFSQDEIPEPLAMQLAERLDREPDTSIAALSEETGYPSALIEFTVAQLRGQHTRECRIVARG